MQVYFDEVPISNGSTIPFYKAQGEVDLRWSTIPGMLYTVMIYDTQAPSGTYLHFMEVNVPDGDLSKGRVVLDYEKPNPPAGETHSYTFVAYEQDGMLKTRGPKGRVGFNVQTHVSRNRLTNPVYSVISVESKSLYENKYMPSVVSPLPSPMRSFSPLPSPSRTVPSLPSSPMRTAPPPTKSGYFKEGSNLSDAEQRMCRCRLHVGAKQTDSCLKDNAWRQQREGKTCYNPYAVCSKSVRDTTSEERSRLKRGICGQSYNFEGIPDNELIAYANMSGVIVPSPYNRENMIRTLEEWKRSKYGY